MITGYILNFAHLKAFYSNLTALKKRMIEMGAEIECSVVFVEKIHKDFSRKMVCSFK